MEEQASRFIQLFDTYYEDVLRYAARRVDPETARDVTAETFLIAWRKWSAVPLTGQDTLPWLYGVARKVLANETRRERRSERLVARIIADRRDQDAVMAPDPGDHVAGALALAQALEALSPADREVLQLLGWEELTVRQAALVMGCTPATMAVRAFRAKRRFLAVLAERHLRAEPDPVPQVRSERR
ncbi:RNA polymerase sigma factor [Streptosporangium sandarakinum]|uniref:RNA polymerase sigma factor n=1 Tax=Streptosporangium sandarakinum TaxID=1260955 RepID=UPI0036748540